MASSPSEHRLRIAAAGDLHCRDSNREAVVASFAALEGHTDLVLLAGDLTSHGTVAEAEIICDAVADLSAPVFAVLGNHDWHGDEAEGIIARLRQAGVEVLERRAAICQVAGVEVGIVGAKGFVGGFAPRHLPDFGEPSLRAVYEETGVEVGIVGAKGFVGGFAPRHLPDFGEPSLRAVYEETGAEVAALEAGLGEVATCPVRIVLLHYAPIEETLEGEPREIFVFLGSDRLAAPILEHGPDLVLHGHAHEGAAQGRIGETPVRNVSQPVLGRDFCAIELDARSAHSPIP